MEAGISSLAVIGAFWMGWVVHRTVLPPAVAGAVEVEPGPTLAPW